MAPIRQTLILLHLDVFTGRILIEKDQVKKVVYFKKGVPIFLDSNVRSETLGQMLLEREQLNEEQYRQVLEAMQKTGRRQGELIAEMGFLTGYQVYEALRAQLGMKFENCFLLEDAEVTTEEGEKYILNVPELPLDFFRTLLDMTYGTHIADAEENFSGEKTIRLNDPGKEYVQRHSLQPREAKWAHFMDGRHPYSKILEAAAGDEEDLAAFLSVLSAMKFVEATDAPPQRFQRRADQVAKEGPGAEESASPAPGSRVVELTEKPEPKPASPIFAFALQMDQPLHRLLKVHPDAPKGQVKRSYDELVRQFHLDAIELMYREPEEQKVARAVLERLTLAYAVLSDPKRKAEYDQWSSEAQDGKKPPPARIVAEMSIQKAHLFLQKKKYDEAEKEIRRAIEADAEESSYHVELASVLMVKANARKEPPPETVEQELKLAFKLNSGDMDAFFQLGTFYKISGDAEKARNAFRRVLEARPNDLKASAELRLLQKRIDQKGGENVLLKLFKKKETPPTRAEKKADDGDDQD